MQSQGCFFSAAHTVDGRNPAPPDMYENNGISTTNLIWWYPDFFHQPHVLTSWYWQWVSTEKKSSCFQPPQAHHLFTSRHHVTMWPASFLRAAATKKVFHLLEYMVGMKSGLVFVDVEILWDEAILWWKEFSKSWNDTNMTYFLLCSIMFFKLRWCTRLHNYCWWLKSCTTKDDDYPIIYRVLTIPGGAGFQPSTVVSQLIVCFRNKTYGPTSSPLGSLLGCWRGV